MLRTATGPVLNWPNVLSSLRIALAPALLALAWHGWNRIFVVCLAFSFVTDALDGWLARRFHCQTEIGARLDSWSDIVTWLALPVCGWWLDRDVVRQESLFLAVALLFYLGAIGLGFLKFRQLTSYHTWGAKCMAVIASIAVLAFFLTSSPWAIRAFAPVVVLTQLEEILITLTLPRWRANVPSLWHARKMIADK